MHWRRTILSVWQAYVCISQARFREPQINVKVYLAWNNGIGCSNLHALDRLLRMLMKDSAKNADQSGLAANNLGI